MTGSSKDESDGLLMLLHMMYVVVIIALIVCILIFSGVINITNGCLERYDSNGGNKSYTLVNTVQLRANGNYSPDAENPLYGQWVNTGLQLNAGEEIKVRVSGVVSLCKAYVPANNLQQNSAKDTADQLVAIPRVEDYKAPPLSLIFDAKTEGWRNLTEIFPQDRIVVSISKDQKHNNKVSFRNGFVDQYDESGEQWKSAFCNEGLREYSPLCGRYSIYKARSDENKYTKSCESSDVYYFCQWLYDRVRKFMPDWNIDYNPYRDIRHFHEPWNSPDFKRMEPIYKACEAQCEAGRNRYGDYAHHFNNCKLSTWNKTITAEMPEPYWFSGWGLSPRFTDVNQLIRNHYKECSNSTKDDIMYGDFHHTHYFWYSADTATGLLYRLSNDPSIPNANNLGNRYGGNVTKKNPLPSATDQYLFAEVDLDAGKEYYKIDFNYDSNYKILMNIESAGISARNTYLQYRFHASSPNSTGGYVLNIKHTKCRREKGDAYSDTFQDRGRVQYVLMLDANNPNIKIEESQLRHLSLDVNGAGTIAANKENQGTVWMRVKNDPKDYKDSTGIYTVTFSKTNEVGSFLHKVLTPIITKLKNTTFNASAKIIKSMTCYGAPIDSNTGYRDSTNCRSFFSYVKGLLTLYIVIYGLMFMVGIVKVTQTDLIIRVVKVGIVAGLLSDATFNFFSEYVMKIITNFTDQMILNVSGYAYPKNVDAVEALLSNTADPTYAEMIEAGMNNASDRAYNLIVEAIFGKEVNQALSFVFLDEVMSKTFFNIGFLAQLLALLLMGPGGAIYFILIVIALIIMVVSVLRALAVYLIAFVIIALLIALGPIFLTFMLFDATKYLFDNWARFILRYMIEPVVMMIGLIVLVKLFTIYLDNAIGFSVCWKCLIPIKIPFTGLVGINPDFINMPIFCINWFAPWGLDPQNSMLGLNMGHIISLVMISYCMYGYIEIVGPMVNKLTGTQAPSAAGIGAKTADTLEQTVLKKYGLDRETLKEVKKNIINRRSANKKAAKGDKSKRDDVDDEDGDQDDE